MRKILSIWVVIVVIGTIVCDFLILSTKTYSGSSVVNFSVSSMDEVVVVGSNQVGVVASANGYFRIVSGTSMVQGEPKPISGQNFQNSGNLPIGKWAILNGGNVSVEATSETPINIIVNKSIDFWIVIIFLSILFAIVFTMIGIIVIT